ncbi:MAG TPA: PQQ-binding-like beta-propeller repeat protein [Candidatus Solibacter sp.]|nr:PQQ-binding-like beta-propeller repeat protein [Candidatus Solibacter sp.]
MSIWRCGFLVILGLGVPMANAENWPRFRGPNGEGIAKDKGIPIEWTKRDVLWKTAIPGIGHSSPVVWGDRVFLQSATESERVLLCVRVRDGKLLWTRTEPGAKALINDKNSFASSTPATDGKRVYAVFWDGRKITLHAFDFDGKPLWRRDLGGFKSQHGPAISPTVVEDRVIIANDQDESAVLLAFDVKDGKPLWQAPRQHFRACYSVPFVLEHKGAASELIVGSTAGVTSYDPRTGDVNWNWTWKFDGMALRTVASPIHHRGFILLNSGDGSGLRHTVALKLNGTGKDAQPTLAWQNTEREHFPYVPCLLAYGDCIFYATDKGFAGCRELRSGKEVWHERMYQNVTASPVLIDGKVYAVSEQGDVYVFEASPTYKQLGRNSLDESVSATPAVAENRLFIRGEKHLFCIGKSARN